jgi:hypothetical protein
VPRADDIRAKENAMAPRLKRSVLAAACVISVAGALCSCAPARHNAPAAAVTGKRLELDLVPGSSFRQSVGFLFFRFSHGPQIACWLETPQGAYVETVYVTATGATKRWFGAPAAGRPEALPVWDHARRAAASPADAVSGATPAGTLRVESGIAGALPAGTYVVKLEINSSFDYNERYTRSTSGVNGQPSLVYSGRIEVGRGEASAELAPTGTGSIDGSDGSITPGLDGITTALQILHSARILYHAQ